MISLEKLQPVLEGYKEYFPLQFNGEKTKKSTNGKLCSIFRSTGILKPRILDRCSHIGAWPHEIIIYSIPQKLLILMRQGTISYKN